MGKSVVHRGSFKPGNLANPNGRPSGVPNQITARTREIIALAMEGQVERINTELASLKGKDFIAAITSLLDFAIPRMNRTELSDPDGNAVGIKQVFLIGGKEVEF